MCKQRFCLEVRFSANTKKKKKKTVYLFVMCKESKIVKLMRTLEIKVACCNEFVLSATWPNQPTSRT